MTDENRYMNDPLCLLLADTPYSRTAKFMRERNDIRKADGTTRPVIHMYETYYALAYATAVWAKYQGIDCVLRVTTLPEPSVGQPPSQFTLDLRDPNGLLSIWEGA